MTQAKTAIHKESTVANPAFMVCRVARIPRALYAFRPLRARLLVGEVEN